MSTRNLEPTTTATTTTTTADGKTIKVIPATKSLHPERDGVKPTRNKLRVAAYCRVSTLLEEQQSSYIAQQEYYKQFISRNPNWELVGIYGDEGKSGTSLRGRTGFLEMIDDVRAGKIDKIITKATSRFGRNTAEFIQILDELDSYGVEVWFESEGIMTSGQQNRMMLQIMGATNEHYSSTLSNNVRWSKERSMREGKVHFNYKRFLGYEKGPDGNPKINEKEAITVRLIFELFLKGYSYSAIARHLNANGHLTPTKTPGAKWTPPGVKRILENEKYAGDVLLQKTFKRSYLDKRAQVNNGERPQVLIENNHEAIIDKATFAKAKEMIKARATNKNYGTNHSLFTGKIICERCEDYYRHRTWNSRGRIKYAMWVCSHKYTEETAYTTKRCKSVNLKQDWIEQGYLYTMNQLLATRSETTAQYEQRLRRIEHQLDSGEITNEIKTLKARVRELDQAGEKLKQEWELTFGRNEEYVYKQAELKVRMNEALTKKAELEDKLNSLRARKAELTTFLNTFNSLPDKLTTFSKATENIFINTIDHISVNSRNVTYHFYGDEKLKLSVEELKQLKI